MAQALLHLRGVLHPAILNHSIRTSLIATHLGGGALTEDEQDDLTIACLFHDSGTAEMYNGDRRFEVEGAAAAVNFLDAIGWAPARCAVVWRAIALHTSAGIAEHGEELVRLTRLAVLEDFGSGTVEIPDRAALAEGLRAYERLDIEEVLGRTVVAQALENPRKAPRASWPGQLLAAHLANPDRTGINAAF